MKNASGLNQPQGDETIVSLFRRAMALPFENRRTFVEEACVGSPELAERLHHLLDENGLDPATRSVNVATDLQGKILRRAASKSFSKHYQERSLIGHGGQGSVWRVLDTRVRRVVAMKIIEAQAPSQGNPSHMDGMLLESQVGGSLRHAAIPTVHEAGETPAGEGYFTMELIEDAVDLATAHSGLETAKGRGSFLSLVDDLIVVCQAVSYAHTKGVMHLDLKPSNVLKSRRGKGSVYVVDWGLSGILLGGSPPYMAPEQIVGDPTKIGATTDVFGLGALMYRLLVGQAPFCQIPAGACPVQSPERGRRRSRLRIDAAAPNVPKPLRMIVSKCLRRAGGDAYSSMAEVETDLRAFARREPIPSVTPSVFLLAASWVRNHKGKSTTAAALLALMWTSVGYWSRNAEAEAARRHAETQRYSVGLHATSRMVGTKGERTALLGFESWWRAEEAAGFEDAERFGWEWGHMGTYRSVHAQSLMGSSARACIFLPSGGLLVGDSGGGISVHDGFGQSKDLVNIGDAVQALLIDSSGTHFFAVTRGSRVSKHDLVDGRTHWIFRHEPGPERQFEPQAVSAALGANGTVLVGTREGTVVLIASDGEEGSVIHDFSSQGYVPIVDVAFDDLGHALVSGAGRLYSMTMGGEIVESRHVAGDLDLNQPYASFFALTGDGFVTADIAGYVRRWRWADSAPYREHRLSEGPARRVCLVGDDLVAVQLMSGGVVGLDTDGAIAWSFHDGIGVPWGFSIAESPTRIASCGRAGELAIRTVGATASYLDLLGHQAAVGALAFRPDGGVLASGSDDQSVQLWDTRTGLATTAFRGHDSQVLALDWGPGARRLASGDMKGTVNIWDPAECEPVASFNLGTTYAIRQISWGNAALANPEVLCVHHTTGHSKIVALDCISGHARELRVEQNLWNCQVLSQGRRCELSQDGRITIRSRATEDVLLSIRFEPTGGGKANVAVSAAGEVALARHDSIELYTAEGELRTSRPIETLTKDLAWMDNGRRLVGAQSDGRFRVYDTQSLSLLLVGHGHRAQLESIAVDPTGDLLATADLEGRIRLWSSSGDFFDQRFRLDEQLREAEVSQYVETVLVNDPRPAELSHALDAIIRERSFGGELATTVRRLGRLRRNTPGLLVRAAWLKVLGTVSSTEAIREAEDLLSDAMESLGHEIRINEESFIAIAGAIAFHRGRYLKAVKLLNTLDLAPQLPLHDVKVSGLCFLCLAAAVVRDEESLGAAQHVLSTSGDLEALKESELLGSLVEAALAARPGG